MAKNKERSEVEFLRSENRRLKSENRNLKKQLSRSKKREHLHQDLEERLAEEYLEEDAQEEFVINSKERCPKCSGEIDIVDLGVRTLISCTSCNYRKSKKK